MKNMVKTGKNSGKYEQNHGRTAAYAADGVRLGYIWDGADEIYQVITPGGVMVTLDIEGNLIPSGVMVYAQDQGGNGYDYYSSCHQRAGVCIVIDKYTLYIARDNVRVSYLVPCSYVIKQGRVDRVIDLVGVPTVTLRDAIRVHPISRGEMGLPTTIRGPISLITGGEKR